MAEQKTSYIPVGIVAAIIAASATIILFIFQLVDTKVERAVDQSIRLMERVSALETRLVNCENRQDRLREEDIKLFKLYDHLREKGEKK